MTSLQYNKELGIKSLIILNCDNPLYDSYPYCQIVRSLCLPCGNRKNQWFLFVTVTISEIRVTKSAMKSPYQIMAETGKTGNIFFEGDTVSFDVSFQSEAASENRPY